MPYGNTQEQSLPIVFHLTGEDAIKQNGYWERRFALYYVDDLGDEVLWEFDGVMAGGFAAIRATPNNESEHILFLHTSNGGVVLGPTGVLPEEQFSIKLVVQQSDTSSLGDIGKCYWDIYVIDGSGRHIYLYEGDAALNRNVT